MKTKTKMKKKKNKAKHIYIYIDRYIYFSKKNAINTNCLIINDPLLLCQKDSQGVVINI